MTREDQSDAAEWLAMEAERDARPFGEIATGCGKVGKPHPQSYRPDLPLRGIGLGESKPTCKWPLTAAEKRQGIPKPTRGKPAAISPNKPHPDSYRPDMPLRSSLRCHGERTSYAWSLTAAERKQLAARPLTYSREVFPHD